MVEKIIEFSAHNKFLVLVLPVLALAGALYAVRNVPLDAIPDLSDTQVIVYSRWDRSPDIIEDQVTYPGTTPPPPPPPPPPPRPPAAAVPWRGARPAHTLGDEPGPPPAAPPAGGRPPQTPPPAPRGGQRDDR